MVSLEAAFGEDAGILGDLDYRLLLLATVIGPLTNGMISPVLDTLTGTFGVTTARIGLMVSVTTAPAIVLIPLAGSLADRYGRKPLLVWGSVLFGVAGALVAATDEFALVLALRFAQGVGFSAIVPTVITSIGDRYEGAEEATAQGLRFIVIGAVLLTFPVIAGALVVVAWQLPFLIYLIAIPIAATTYRWLDEPATVERSERETDLGGLLRLAGHPRVFPIIIARSLPTLLWFAFFTYNSILVVRLLGGTPGQAGLLVGVGSVAFAVAGSQAGRLTRLLASRYYPLVLANLALGAGFVSFVLAPSVVIAAAGIGLAGIGFGLSVSLYRSLITGFAPPGLRGGLVSLNEAVSRIAATAAPVGMGLAIAWTAPTLGFGGALRTTGVAVGVAATLLGLLCLVAARTAPGLPRPG